MDMSQLSLMLSWLHMSLAHTKTDLNSNAYVVL